MTSKNQTRYPDNFKVLTYWPFSFFQQVHAKKDPGGIPLAFSHLGAKTVLIVGKMVARLNGEVEVVETGNYGKIAIRNYIREAYFVSKKMFDEEADINLIFNWSNLNTFIAVLYRFLLTVSRSSSRQGKLLLKMDSDGSFADDKFTLGKFIYCSLLVVNSFIFDYIIIENSCGFSKIKKFIIDPKKIKIIGNGISKEIFTADLNSAKEKVIIGVGRISPEKGFDITIKAFYFAVKKHKDWKLEVIGPIQDHQYYESLVKMVEELGLSDSVKFLGELGDDELVHKLNTSAIYCTLSRRESFNIARLEALSFDMAVLSSEAGCGKDFEKYGAILVDSIEPESVARQIVTLMDSFPNTPQKLQGKLTVPSWGEIALEIGSLSTGKKFENV